MDEIKKIYCAFTKVPNTGKVVVYKKASLVQKELDESNQVIQKEGPKVDDP